MNERRAVPLRLAGLHLLVLWSFAVAQPLFELLGKSAEFFAARGVRIGLSIDGPADRTAQRVIRGGNPAYPRIVKGIEKEAVEALCQDLRHGPADDSVVQRRFRRSIKRASGQLGLGWRMNPFAAAPAK